MVWEELDEKLVEALRVEPRASVVTLAQRLYTSRAVVSERLQYLTSHNLMRIVAAVHPGFRGLNVIAHLSISTTGPIKDLTERLVERESCLLVSITAGEYDVVVELRVAAHSDLQRALGQLRAHHSVVRIDTVLYSEIIHGSVEHRHRAEIAVDQIDHQILTALEEDGRLGWKALSRITGKSPSAVRSRVHRLLEARIARIVVAQQRGGGSSHVSAGVGLTLGEDSRDILGRLISIEGVEFAVTCVGRFDAILTVRGNNSMAIDQCLEKVRAVAGVRGIVTWLHLRSAKIDYARMGMVKP